MQLIELETVDSTNDEAKRRIESGLIESRTVITAREQSAGRGTRGRAWISPRDTGLYLTYVDPHPVSPAPTTTLTMAAAVACSEALAAIGIEVGIRPVNDLVVEGRKLGGILTETVIRGGAVCAIIVGVGLNLRRDERQVDEGALEAISLEDMLPAVPDATVVRDAIVIHLPEWIDRSVDTEAVVAWYDARRVE